MYSTWFVCTRILDLTIGHRAKGTTMTTSKKDASKASKLLSSPKTSKTVKSVAGSDLAQAKQKGGSKKK
jgi:hypothetical protein